MKKALPIIIAVVVAGASGFYGGIKYNETPSANTRANFQGMRGEQSGGGARGGSGGFANGEIIAKNDKSLTVKLRNGSSKIVLLTASTPVMKSVSGSVDDLAAGKQITAVGNSNADGSLTAQSIQIRPEGLGQPANN